jgi:fluoroquinolone resistance protein
MKFDIQEDRSFNNINYSEKETKNSEFENCSFVNCDFSDSILSSCFFIDCVFTNCNMTMVKLTNCQLKNITFKDSKLLGINFTQCKDSFSGLKFNGCVLDYCSFAGKKMMKTSFINSSIKNADFSECDLTGSAFINSDLMSSIFNRTILKEADFLTALNFNIDPENNNVKKAKFSFHGLSGLLNKYDIKIE